MGICDQDKYQENIENTKAHENQNLKTQGL